MGYWPVPESYSKTIPSTGAPGSFWENRGDRQHCGVDIYAPPGCDVLSIEEGEVIDAGVFTSPDKVPYWNTTYYILIKNKAGFVCRYAELADVAVAVGEAVKAGQLIAHVGLVLDSEKIVEDSPPYIQDLKEKGNLSMLHFELYRSTPNKIGDYLGGSCFGDSKPENLRDPTDYLRSTVGATTQ